MKFLLFVVACIFGGPVFAGVPTSFGTLRGVLVQSVFQTGTFTVSAGDLKSCVTRTAGADWTLYSCEVAMPFVADTPAGTQYVVFDKVIVIEAKTVTETQYQGTWRSSSSDLLQEEPVVLQLYKKPSESKLTGRFVFKDLDYSIAVKATYED